MLLSNPFVQKLSLLFCLTPRTASLDSILDFCVPFLLPFVRYFESTFAPGILHSFCPFYLGYSGTQSCLER